MVWACLSNPPSYKNGGWSRNGVGADCVERLRTPHKVFVEMRIYHAHFVTVPSKSLMETSPSSRLSIDTGTLSPRRKYCPSPMVIGYCFRSSLGLSRYSIHRSIINEERATDSPLNTNCHWLLFVEGQIIAFDRLIVGGREALFVLGVQDRDHGSLR